MRDRLARVASTRPLRRAAARGASAALLAGVLALPAPATAQELPRDCGFLGGWAAPMYLDGLRIRELAGAADVDPNAAMRGSGRRLACAAGADSAGGLRLRLLPLDALGAYNSAYPRGGIDGLRWAGTGFSGSLRGGVEGRWGVVSAALAPEFAYQRNADFPIIPATVPGWSPFAYRWQTTSIDWPQRFGEEPFLWTGLGESYVRVDAYGAAAGFSNEALRWGPARRNPLLMSGAAPGFPHVFLGTGRPVDIWIGRLSAELVWGHLAESDFFDGEPDNDRRLIAGAVATFQPRGLEGLSVGFIRSYLELLPPDGFGLMDYLREPYGELLTNKPSDGGFGGDNELFAFFARWVLPESGFEVYGEYARDDMWDGWDDLIKEPEHSAALTAGFQKLQPVGSRRVRVAGELTSMNFSETHRSGRNEVIFYTHHSVRQGYTHRGQLLGAPIGPSSDAQSLEADLLGDRWLAGLYIERVRYANDLYWRTFGRRYTYKGHDVEVTGGLRAAWLVPVAGVTVLGDVAWSGRYNRDFIALASTTYTMGFEHNLSVRIGASWTPASGRSGPGGGPASPPARP